MPDSKNFESHTNVAIGGVTTNIKQIDWDVNPSLTGSQVVEFGNSISSIASRLDVDYYRVTDYTNYTPDQFDP